MTIPTSPNALEIINSETIKYSTYHLLPVGTGIFAIETWKIAVYTMAQPSYQ